jgi:ABC-2 type transport system ATP-binding protein
MSAAEIVISVKDVKKQFKIPLEKSSGIKQQIINHLKGRKGYREFNALKGITFDIKKGEFFGIVGRNGSGKSTLLKMLAEIYTPTSGSVHVKGTLVPFIELGVGFNPELSGRENVYLNGALLGFSRKQVDAMYGDIVSFAELDGFMDERLKNYSSGMQVRLAFSIAIRAEGDILLLDEVLAVGDEAFQKKCTDYFNEQRGKRTIILVTHNMQNVREYCTKAMLLDEGIIKDIGDPDRIAQEYSELFI